MRLPGPKIASHCSHCFRCCTARPVDCHLLLNTLSRTPPFSMTLFNAYITLLTHLSAHSNWPAASRTLAQDHIRHALYEMLSRTLSTAPPIPPSNLCFNTISADLLHRATCCYRVSPASILFPIFFPPSIDPVHFFTITATTELPPFQSSPVQPNPIQSSPALNEPLLITVLILPASGEKESERAQQSRNVATSPTISSKKLR